MNDANLSAQRSQRTLRLWHRKLAPILFLPLALAALTGTGYRLARSWFGLSDEWGDRLLALHQGEFLGRPLVPVYVLLVGLGLLAAIATGLSLWQASRAHRAKQSAAAGPLTSWRSLHRFLAPLAFLPLALCAITGIAYRIGEDWLGLPDERVEIFMTIHQGSYLGGTLRPFYVLLVGLGLVLLLVSGLQMTGLFRRRRPLPPSDG